VIRYALRRLAIAIPLALAVATLVFVLMESAPGDAADQLIGERPVPPEVRERIERIHGLDRSPLARYGGWLSALFLEGDLGWSHSRQRPVAQLLGETLPPTLALAAAALLLHLLAGTALGIVSAARRGSWIDRLLTVGGLALYAMPVFWLGLMAILGLSYALPLFPASSLQSVGASDWPLWRQLLDRLWHLTLPAAVLGLASAAAMTRFVRSGLLEALGQEFVRSARARGIGGGRVMLVHALRNALLPVINLVGLSLPLLLSGSLVVEVVFAWPGMGRLTYEAIRAQDLAVVMATTVLATLLVIVGNLVADLVMAAADPRIRLAPRERGD
jgi:peptide/nickel transport system permease protein